MAEVKLVVIFPRPKDVDALEKIYQTEHVPLAVARLGGKTKIVTTKILDSPRDLRRVSQCFFSALRSRACFQSLHRRKVDLCNPMEGRKAPTGGTPIFLVTEEETFPLKQTANA